MPPTRKVKPTQEREPPDSPVPHQDESLLPVPQIHEEVSTGPLFERLKTGELVPIPATNKTADIKADPRAEYVAGGAYYVAATYLRTLSFAVDDVTQAFGDDLYDRVMTDGQVKSDIRILILSILADGINLLPAIDRWQTDPQTGQRTEHPRWEEALAIQEFCERNIGDLTTAFDPNTASALYWAIYELLRGIAYGNKIAEKVYALATTGQDKGRLILARLKVKARRNCAFVVDPYLNLKGIIALIPGTGMPVLVQSLLGDPSWLPNLLPRRKFCVFTFEPENADPRGTSLLRGVYDAWFVKQQIKQERLAYLARFSGGAVWGECAPGDEPVQVTNAEGVVQTDGWGQPLVMTAQGAMTQSLVQWRNGTVMSVPNGASIHVEYPPSGPNPFDAALDRQDREITQAILGQTRATHEAEHGSRADSETGQDILGLNVAHGKAALALMIRNDILLDLVEFNYGVDALDLLPRVVLSKTQQQDFATTGATVAELMKAEYFAASQLPEVDSMLGVPVRTAEEAQLLAEKQGAAIEALKAPKPAPGQSAQNMNTEKTGTGEKTPPPKDDL